MGIPEVAAVRDGNLFAREPRASTLTTVLQSLAPFHRMMQLTHALGFHVSIKRYEKRAMRPSKAQRTNVAVKVDDTESDVRQRVVLS